MSSIKLATASELSIRPPRQGEAEKGRRAALIWLRHRVSVSVSDQSSEPNTEHVIYINTGSGINT